MTSRIVTTASKALCPFILLFGIYIIFYGHISPGGGFQGGVILAMGVILYIIGVSIKKMQQFIPYFLFIEIICVFLFIIVGFSGIVCGKQFLTNFQTIPLLNIIIGLKVFAGLIILFVYLFTWELKND